MNITIDLRSLHTAQHSGVEYFMVHAIEQLLKIDPKNQYTLYYNGFKARQFDQFHFINAHYKQTRIPNRALNLLQKFLRWPDVESLAGRTDTVLMPNLGITKISSTTKLVLVVHDLSPVLMPEMYSLKSRVWHRLVNLPKLARRADKILAVSEFTKQALVNQLQIDSNKIKVGLLGVDHERYHANLDSKRLREVRNNYNLPVEFVLFVGTVEPRKNVSRLIEALKYIPSHVHLVIAGKLGWKYREIIQTINNSSEARRIHYLGYVAEEDKPYLLKLARVMVWPSLYEGFGLPVLEAMAVGTPVVSSSVTSIPEVAGDAAILVNPYNIADIGKAVEMLIDDSPLRADLIRKGLQRAARFSWEHTGEVLRSIL